MRNVIDTNVWIDALSGKLSAAAFLKITVEASWAGYSAITRLELFGLPGLKDEEEYKISELLKPFPEIAVDSKIIDRAIPECEKPSGSKCRMPLSLRPPLREGVH